MWAAFWCNPGNHRAKELSLMQRAALYKTVVAVFLWKVSRWPFQVSIAQELDAIQSQMLARILPCVPHVNEDPDHFYRRRLRQARNVASHAGLWSSIWAKRSIDWQNHVLRGVDHRHFCFKICTYHDHDWF